MNHRTRIRRFVVTANRNPNQYELPRKARYPDKFVCPRCGFDKIVVRLQRAAGRRTKTWCNQCEAHVGVMAGPIPEEINQ